MPCPYCCNRLLDQLSIVARICGQIHTVTTDDGFTRNLVGTRHDQYFGFDNQCFTCRVPTVATG
ncbi:hypothetical protein, partial [Microseira wollei]|uniref:hypothetical protein n=1 Tax=Microseira wollei TaxID=467598 RepID=UPI001CFCD9C7